MQLFPMRSLSLLFIVGAAACSTHGSNPSAPPDRPDTCLHRGSAHPSDDDLDGSSIGVVPRPDNTLPFPIVDIDLFRSTNDYTNPSLSFLPDDLFGMTVFAGGPLRTGFVLNFQACALTHEDVEFSVGPVQVMGSGTLPGQPTTYDYGQQATSDTVDMQWDQGSTPSIVDATPVVAATLRLGTMPVAEGAPMGVDVSIAFDDGGVLHLRVVAPVSTLVGGVHMIGGDSITATSPWRAEAAARARAATAR
jgi:hypothetical protein